MPREKDNANHDSLAIWPFIVAIPKFLPRLFVLLVTLPISVPCLILCARYDPRQFPLAAKIGYGLIGGWPFTDHWGVAKGGPVVHEDGTIHPAK